jgi:enoyl-CoA hydratase/carnithine racemase
MIRWQTQPAGWWDVVLDAPPCNEIGEPMLDALEGLVAALAGARPPVVVLRSAQVRGFCAGADLRTLAQGMASEPDAVWVPRVAAFLDRIHAVMDALDTHPGVVVAALHGVCFGGGLELALTADLRVAEAGTRLAFPEVRLGLVPGFGGVPRLRREVGEATVRHLVLEGASLPASRAHALGLVQHCVARGEAAAMAGRLANHLMRQDPDALAHAKAFTKTLPREALAEERRLFLAMIQAPAARSGLATFVDRRDAMTWLPAPETP